MLANMRKLLLLAASIGYAFAQSPAPRDLQLFLLIGQSNMAGRGPMEAQNKEAVPGIFTLNKLDFIQFRAGLVRRTLSKCMSGS